jgi:hypothetical protein
MMMMDGNRTEKPISIQDFNCYPLLKIGKERKRLPMLKVYLLLEKRKNQKKVPAVLPVQLIFGDV